MAPPNHEPSDIESKPQEPTLDELFEIARRASLKRRLRVKLEQFGIDGIINGCHKPLDAFQGRLSTAVSLLRTKAALMARPLGGRELEREVSHKLAGRA